MNFKEKMRAVYRVVAMELTTDAVKDLIKTGKGITDMAKELKVSPERLNKFIEKTPGLTKLYLNNKDESGLVDQFKKLRQEQKKGADKGEGPKGEEKAPEKTLGQDVKKLTEEVKRVDEAIKKEEEKKEPVKEEPKDAGKAPYNAGKDLDELVKKIKSAAKDLGTNVHHKTGADKTFTSLVGTLSSKASDPDVKKMIELVKDHPRIMQQMSDKMEELKGDPTSAWQVEMLKKAQTESRLALGRALEWILKKLKG